MEDMRAVKAIGIAMTEVLLAGCEGPFDHKTNKTTDRGFDAKSLSELKAGIWIDPNGCDHWIIDDGLEGYLSQRLGRSGKPVCSESGFVNTTIGDFKRCSAFLDAI